MPGRGRPMSLRGVREELLCELQALTAESMRNELERARVLRQLARLESGAGELQAVGS